MHSLNRSVSCVCATFFLLLTIVLSLASYRIYTGAMYERHQKQMESIADYIQAQMDQEDLAQCAKSYEETEKYRDFQAFFDHFADNYQDIHSLWIMQVLPGGAVPRVRVLCRANSSYEKQYEPAQVLRLGDSDESWLSPEGVEEFYQIQMGDEDAFLLNCSFDGKDYTLARPLMDAAGEHFGLLCVSISTKDLHHTVYRNVNMEITLIVLSGIGFLFLLLLWLRTNLTDPLKRLERSVADFSATSAGQQDPAEVEYQPPEIYSRNEVQSLSEAITKLTIDLREYVQHMADAKDRTRGLRADATKMNSIAFRDALTQVNNKAAYDRDTAELNWAIRNRGEQFALVMVDLNYLKVINDRYGHEHGNEYIIGACGLICDVFDPSTVYRLGGDEFVALLRGRDWEERDARFRSLLRLFAQSVQQEDADPWQRCSAAAGMAVSEPGEDVEAVFNRADLEMYRAKAEMKAGR